MSQQARENSEIRSQDSPNFQQIILLQDKFVRGKKSAQHRLSTRFAAMLQDELSDFVARITVAQGPDARCKFSCNVAHNHRQPKQLTYVGRKYRKMVYNKVGLTVVCSCF